MPVLFVRVEELEALAADGTLTKEELLGAESLILIGMDLPVHDALRAVGEGLRAHERALAEGRWRVG